ncbi:MAG: ShlB/FhaC/HecB family hemolysin secretion/activation protein [Candidatus Omnitrophica bacterium]|nr:ShlB/FhaC/HecB family hemolysin secretion/activation protein [Candidatus Omnitrophota bacterium]
MKEEEEKRKEETFKETRVEVQVAPERKPEAVPQIQFFVKQIHLSGNTIFTLQELEKLVEPYENQELTLEKVKELTKQITQKYHDRGYRTSFAYLPRQEFREGDLKIAILEGKLGEILVQGNRFFRKHRIRSYFKMHEGEVLNVKKIEQALRYLNEHSDRKVRVELKAGKKPETSDVIVIVKDKLPLHGAFRFDNEGVESSGELRYRFTLFDKNLTSLDDTFSIGTVFGQYFGFLFTQYELPIPQTRSKITGSFSHGQATPKKDIKPFGVNSVSQAYNMGLEQSLFRTARFSMDVGGGFELRESRTLVEARTYTRERLRILHVDPRILWASPWGILTLVNEFRFGFNAPGASIHADPDAARQGVEPNFFVYSARFFHVHKMPRNTKLHLQVELQHPSRKLPSQEALYLGGAASVRGYPEGDYLADSGIRYSLEYLFPMLIFPKEWRLPFSKVTLREQAEFVCFFDEGYGRLRGPSQFEASSRHLMGTGGGVRFKIHENIFARAEWGAAIGNHPLRAGNRHEFNFRIQMER